MRFIFIIMALLAFALPAQAALFSTIDSRGDKISAELKGNNSYHAYLARDLTSIASSEYDEGDASAARVFINKAEAEAAKARGTK